MFRKLVFFFFNDTATTEIYTLSLHDALPICELGTGPLVEVMVEHVEAARGQLAVELFARRVGVGGALLEIDHRDAERRDRLRPLDSGVIVERFDDRGDETGGADAIRAHMNRA